jgi:glycosyltransferase involved in cell wall biosynthesis
MAASQRVLLEALALKENNVGVTVLCTQVTERPPYIENAASKGTFKGIHFEYTSGTTVRASRFAERRYRELRGILQALGMIGRLRAQSKVDCVYLWFPNLDFTLTRLVVSSFIQALRIPMAIDLSERPWTLKEGASVVSRSFSPLTGVRGAVVISAFLREWVSNEVKQRRQTLSVIDVPILVDAHEEFPEARQDPIANVVFAGSPSYKQTITFILESMEEVWRRVPSCRLVLTGARPQDPQAAWIRQEVAGRRRESSVQQVGYLERPDLLKTYKRAWALLIPLFDDVRSKARFPTKLGEYLLASRPVVTNGVGEIDRYLHDGVTGLLCPPGDPKVYGLKILEALSDRSRSEKIGAAGREMAESAFHFRRFGPTLAGFFGVLA